MTSFFGPENPQPFAVISEKYRRDLQLIKQQAIETNSNECVAEMFSLGTQYNQNFCDAIREYGEIDIDLRVAYVGPKKGSLANEVANQLDLVYPIEHIVAGGTLFEDTVVDARSIAVRQVSVGADDFFQRTSQECQINKSRLFDRVIVRDAVEFLHDRRKFFMNVMECIEKPNGRMLLFHRSSKLLTLPFYSEAKQKIAESDIDFMDLISELNQLQFNVEWEIITLPAIVSRVKWLSLLYYQYPVQLEINSPVDIYAGLRELAEGSLKYADENIEFIDRMILIVVSHPEICPNPVQRLGGTDISYIPTPQIYRINVTSPDLEDRYQRLLAAAPTYSGPAEWWGTVAKDKWISVDSSKIPKARMNNLIKDDPPNKKRQRPK